jgi:hypothetical protein
MTEMPEFEVRRAALGVSAYRVLGWTRPDVTHVPGSKLSFARLGSERLADAVRRAQHDLSLIPSFGGFAFHHYRSYRQLLSSASGGGMPPEPQEIR